MFNALHQDQARNRVIFLPAERVYPPVDAQPIAAGSAYCRLWLRRMRLSRTAGWFRTYYPVVYATTSFTYGRQKITVPCLAGPGRLAEVELTQNNYDQVIRCNCPLTPRFPFKGGDIELQVGLFRMVANDPIKRFITAVEGIAKLLPIPEFSTIITLITPVQAAIEGLMGAGEGQLQIGYAGHFSAARAGVAASVNDLRDGYFAVISDEQQTLDPEKLCVVNGELMVGAKGMQGEFKNTYDDLNQCSYMLFQVERYETQELGMLHAIDKLGLEAQEARLLGDSKKAEEIYRQLISVIVQSADLLPSQQNRLVYQIKDQLARLLLQSAQPKAPLSLAAMMNKDAELATDAETEALLAEWREFYKNIDKTA